MITHVVMMKMQDRGQAPEVQRRLQTLPGQIAEIRVYDVGLDELHGPRAWDLVLVSTFADLAGLTAYIDHPAHQEVVAFINEVTETRASVDFTSA
jgi:hypothetical protein